MKAKRKLFVFLALILLVILLERVFDLSGLIGTQGSVDLLKKRTEDNRSLAVLIYLSLTIAGCVVLALPGVTFAILAGVLFGPWEGTLWCVIAVTSGAGLSFLAGRYFLKDAVKPIVAKNKLLKAWLFDETGRHEILLLMVTRLVPIFPYNLQNFAYGITDIAFGRYMLYTFLFIIPGTAMYTIGTAGILDPSNRLTYMGLAFGLALFVVLAARLIRGRFLAPDRPSRP